MNTLGFLLRRELTLAQRQMAEIFNTWCFYLVIVCLSAFVLQRYPHLLPNVAPLLIWIATLFALTLSIDRVFRDDFLDGSLEQLALNGVSFIKVILVKLTLHWCVIVGPILLSLPIVASTLALSINHTLMLALGLLLGTPVALLLMTLVALIILPLQQRGLLLSLLVWPLMMPILLFALGLQHESNSIPFLLSIFCACVSSLPWSLNTLLILLVEN